MGDRGQVLIKDVGVYLYTHNDASGLVETVKAALALKERWDDPEYLARIVFCTMVKGDEDGTTNYGIDSKKHSDVWLLITLNCEAQTVTVNEYRKYCPREYTQTFEEFIQGSPVHD